MLGAIESFSAKEWENFCEVMLRQHYGSKNFTTVPDQDGGDLGIEFFSVDGTIFQCYYPEMGIEMKLYKSRIQKKINDDLKKLDENKIKIKDILDDIKVNQWVLLTPENKSKDLIAYCNKKKKEVLSKKIDFIDNENFIVKIETANSYPSGMLFALNMLSYSSTVNIPMVTVTQSDKEIWKTGNSVFKDNISRKSNALMNGDVAKFEDGIISKYIQITTFLDQLRNDHPDLYGQVQDSALAQLEYMKDNSLFESNPDQEFVKKLVNENKEAFAKFSKHMCENNVSSLSLGYVSKWLAECDMDFVS